jgi:hypothetical protein
MCRWSQSDCDEKIPLIDNESFITFSPCAPSQTRRPPGLKMEPVYGRSDSAGTLGNEVRERMRQPPYGPLPPAGPDEAPVAALKTLTVQKFPGPGTPSLLGAPAGSDQKAKRTPRVGAKLLLWR